MGRPSKLVVGIESVDGEITDVSVSGECVQVGEGTIRL
jgi:predicted PhzF superfamily epimerase YddE/YHI9